MVVARDFGASEIFCILQRTSRVVLFEVSAIDGNSYTLVPDAYGGYSDFVVSGLDSAARVLQKCPVPTVWLHAPGSDKDPRSFTTTSQIVSCAQPGCAGDARSESHSQTTASPSRRSPAVPSNADFPCKRHQTKVSVLVPCPVCKQGVRDSLPTNQTWRPHSCQ